MKIVLLVVAFVDEVVEHQLISGEYYVIYLFQLLTSLNNSVTLLSVYCSTSLGVSATRDGVTLCVIYIITISVILQFTGSGGLFGVKEAVSACNPSLLEIATSALTFLRRRRRCE